MAVLNMRRIVLATLHFWLLAMRSPIQIICARSSFVQLLFATILLHSLRGNAVSGYTGNLSYFPLDPDTLYQPVKSENTTSLLQFIESRQELSSLREFIDLAAGFRTAFNTTPSRYSFTFFAPSNDAFAKRKGWYFDLIPTTQKGKWWIGNFLQHHYLPGTKLAVSSFNSTQQRFMTGNYLYVSGVSSDHGIILNSNVNVTGIYNQTEVTNGYVYIIDGFLDPSFMIFDSDQNTMKQSFIAGGCTNNKLPYC